jgi:ferritin-like metal-binding protein YciE
MSSYSERDTYSQAGDWLLGTVRRNPEALLLMAAGCCLMMRRGSSLRTNARRAYERDEWGYPASRASSQVRGTSASPREGLSRAADAASDTARSAGEYASQAKDRMTDMVSNYASQMKERISDTASEYADSVRDFAGEARRAHSQELRAAFEKHHGETQGQVERLEKVFDLIGKKPQGKTCDAIIGLVEEGQEVIKEYKGSPALDAGLLAGAQAVEHYEISRYGTLKTWAHELGLGNAVGLLDATLQEEKNTDATLTKIAESVVNQEAE